MIRTIYLCILVFCTLIPLQTLAFDRESDSLELVKLYNGTEGDGWTDSWNLDLPMNTWEGVTLNDSGEVIILNLTRNNLVGELPALNLPKILILVLAENTLRTGLPRLTGMPLLSELNLRNNELDGSISDFNLPNLSQLVLSNNNFTGQVPDFQNMPQLATLKLNNNQFSGQISNFSGMPNLLNLDLSSNRLEGPLPDFSGITSLVVLEVSNNNLQFSIPQLGNLQELFVLNLSHNNFTGFMPNFNRLRDLTDLYLNDNNITGPISNEFSALAGLFTLDISNNLLDGQLPDFSANTQLEELRVSGNMFDGAIPTFSTLLSLEILDISNNDYADTLPALDHLESLSEFYADSNFLVHSLFDATQILGLDAVSVHNNYFTFSDLNDVNGLGLGSNFVYAPQRPIPMPDTVYTSIGEDARIDLVVDENFDNNSYEWFLNGQSEYVRPDNELVINNVNALDVGTYYCIVRNDTWPALNLFSEEVYLFMDCPFNVVDIVDSICLGDTLVVNGMRYFETGEYSDTVVVTNPAVCDSICNVTLTVLPTYDTTLMDTICESDQIMFGGEIITESGTYVDTLQTIHGCDSVVTLDLIVNPAFTMVRIDTICDGDTLFVGDRFHTTTDLYMDTLQTRFGCDSVIITDLTVLDSFLSVTTVRLCKGETYDFRGMTYSMSGTYIDIIQNSIGCDSTFVLNLTIPETDTFYRDELICAGDSIRIGDSVYYDAGVYIDSLQTDIGCDSIVVLTLEVVEQYNEVFEFTICRGDTLVFNGDTITRAGIFIDTLMARGGCDSIIRLAVNEVLNVGMTIDTVLCFGDSLMVGDTVYKAPGMYRDTLFGEGTCDTVIATRLAFAPLITLQGVQLRLYSNNLGSVIPEFEGGQGELSYLWNTGSTESFLDSVPPGTYTVTVTDEAGCGNTFEFVLDATTSTHEIGDLNATITLYPNPVSRSQPLTMAIETDQIGLHYVDVFDAYGRQMQRFVWDLKSASAVREIDLNASPGLYYLRMTNGEGRYKLQQFIIR